MGYNFLEASAKAKIANVATNLGAVARGRRFVRIVFLLVVAALILRLGYDVVS